MRQISRLRPSPDVVSQVIEGKTVLLNLQSEYYYGLNEVGSRFWQLLAEDVELAQIAEHLAAEFEVERSTLDRDLQTLVTNLHEAGLVQNTEAHDG